MNRIVLFGAGASHGAGHIVPKVPPLGGDLYKELALYCPQSWGGLPGEIKTLFQANFEQGMQALWDKHSHSIAPLMQHMTLYLAQFRPDDSKEDLYSRFLEGLRGHGVVGDTILSTLNYECVLELAASVLGMKVDYGNGQLDPNAVRIWKLHGSCNFLSTGIQATRGVSFSSGVVFDSGLQPVNPNDAIQYCLANNALYPAMALYMTAKSIQIGQGVIHGLQARWGELIREAKRVLVVGVRPYPADTHIWGPLAECAGDLGYVGPENDFNAWKEAHRGGKPSLWLGPRWNTGFSQSVKFVAEGL